MPRGRELLRASFRLNGRIFLGPKANLIWTVFYRAQIIIKFAFFKERNFMTSLAFNFNISLNNNALKKQLFTG